MSGWRSLLWLPVIVALAGCVERTLTVRSEPSGALVHLNDVEVGRTPVTVPFRFYGTYDVRLSKDGYQTLQTPKKATPPWWDVPGPDLLAEAWPADPRVDIAWEGNLKKAKPVDEERLLDHAKQLRAKLEEETGEGGAKAGSGGREKGGGGGANKGGGADENGGGDGSANKGDGGE